MTRYISILGHPVDKAVSLTAYFNTPDVHAGLALTAACAFNDAVQDPKLGLITAMDGVFNTVMGSGLMAYFMNEEIAREDNKASTYLSEAVIDTEGPSGTNLQLSLRSQVRGFRNYLGTMLSGQVLFTAAYSPIIAQTFINLIERTPVNGRELVLLALPLAGGLRLGGALMRCQRVLNGRYGIHTRMPT